MRQLMNGQHEWSAARMCSAFINHLRPDNNKMSACNRWRQIDAKLCYVIKMLQKYLLSDKLLLK